MLVIIIFSISQNVLRGLLFSSLEHKVLKVSYCDHPISSVRLNCFFKHLLNHWASLGETRQGSSLGEACSKNLMPPITVVAIATKKKKKISKCVRSRRNVRESCRFMKSHIQIYVPKFLRTFEKHLLNLLKSAILDISTIMWTIFSIETLEKLC